MGMQQLRWVSGIILALVLATGCSGPGGGNIGNPMSASEELFQEGVAYLSAGEFELARTNFNELADAPGYECKANYGLVLAGVQDTADRLDVIVDSLTLFLGGAPGYAPQQTFDINPLIENFLEPFESFFEDVMAGLDYVVENECKVTVPDGMPVEVGEPDSLLYFRARFGYEFDAASARVGQAIFASALAGIHSVLAHNLEIDAGELTNTLDTVIDAFRGALDMEVNESTQTVTQQTMISAFRALGSIPQDHPNLLKLADEDRIALVDNDILKALRAIYYDTGTTETGIVAQLEKEQLRDNDTTNNFLGLLDNNNNDRLDEGDSIVIGLRELHLTGLFSEPSITDGIWFNLNPGLGDIDDIMAAAHTIVQVVGNQMASVDDSSIEYRRLGLQEVNALIEAVLILDIFLTPLPEAVEFDFGNYFKNPRGVRDYLPYWSDHDDDNATSDVFLIEGETWVTSPAEPFVSFGDTAHLSGTYTFDPGSGDSETLPDLSIAADGIKPSELSILVPFPLPYVAYQDPSFNNVLYVDADELPIAPDSAGDGMKPATLYSVNKAAASYFRYILESWIFKTE